MRARANKTQVLTDRPTGRLLIRPVIRFFTFAAAAAAAAAATHKGNFTRDCTFPPPPLFSPTTCLRFASLVSLFIYLRLHFERWKNLLAVSAGGSEFEADHHERVHIYSLSFTARAYIHKRENKHSLLSVLRGVRDPQF